MPKLANLFSNAKEYSPIEGRIKGSFPECLQGSLIRNGPGIFDMDSGNFTLNHYFDGFAMIGKFTIKNGKVTFVQKVLETEAYKKSVIAKRNVFAEFGTKAHVDPTKNMFGKMFNKLVPLELTDNTTGSVYCIGDQLYAAYESCYVHNVDIDSLLTKERHDFAASLGAMTVSCHPLADVDGTVWNVAVSMLSGCKYQIFKVPVGAGKDALKSQKIVTTIPSSWRTCVSFVHSFGMTKNYIVFMEQPMVINCVKLAQMGIKGKPIRDAFEWHPVEKNRIYVVEKATGNVLKTKFKTEDAFFFFHFGNCYEENDQIVVDIITYPTGLVFDKFELDRLRSNAFDLQDPSQFERFVIPVVTSEVKNLPEGTNLAQVNGVDAKAYRQGDTIVLTGVSVGPTGFEYPKYNPKYLTKSAQYTYGSGTYDQSGLKNAMCKMDLHSGDVCVHKSERDDEYFSEPVFVPNKGNKDGEEDAGLVLTAVSCNDPKEPDYLLCLDAKEFKEVGRAEFDAKFLQGFHGVFLDKC